MKQETEIKLAAAEALGGKYDNACKALFQNREIIAPVLKEVVPEYKDFTVEEIIRYIDADSIEDVPVDDISVMADRLPTEMESVSDKLIRYDAHFRAVNPRLSNENLCIHLYIDLEVQNHYRPSSPSYPIIKRGIYYAAREISSQLGVLTEQTNYGNLQKVYSIWICNEKIPRRLQNTVTMYSVKKTDIIGTTDEPKENYDLMNIIMIRRGTDAKEPIFDYLSGVFGCDKKKISEYVDIHDNETVLKGVDYMTGLGFSIMQKGMAQGIERGETLLATLVGCLKKDGRLNELDHLAEEEIRKRLYKEYDLIDVDG